MQMRRRNRLMCIFKFVEQSPWLEMAKVFVDKDFTKTTGPKSVTHMVGQLRQ